MTLSELSAIAVLVVLAIVLVMFSVPPLALLWLYWIDRRQDQHAVLRNFPLLGRLRYLFEQIGPELRQYLFNSDMEGKPFSRNEYRTVVVSGKYMNTLMSFGSKRDFDEAGWYLRNALLPKLDGELAVVREPKIGTHRYRLEDEGLFARHEHLEGVEVSPWTLPDSHAPVVGGGSRSPGCCAGWWA